MTYTYEVCLADSRDRPLTEWGTLTPRTIFDLPQTLELKVLRMGRATHLLSKTGERKPLSHPLDLINQSTVKLTAGGESRP